MLCCGMGLSIFHLAGFVEKERRKKRRHSGFAARESLSKVWFPMHTPKKKGGPASFNCSSQARPFCVISVLCSGTAGPSKLARRIGVWGETERLSLRSVHASWPYYVRGQPCHAYNLNPLSTQHYAKTRSVLPLKHAHTTKI